MMNILSKFTSIIITTGILSGCGLSTFTQRESDPLIRDYFDNLHENVKIMTTDSSRRLVYEFNHGGRSVYCSDASPDTSIAVSGAISGEVQATIPSGTPGVSGNGTLKGSRSSSTATMPLVRRSQGLQWGRDQAATECLLFAMGVINAQEYRTRLDTIRTTSVAIIQKEVEKGIHDLPLMSETKVEEPKTGTSAEEQ